MIEPYQAIGLVPTMWGIRKREDIFKNIEHLDHLVTASTWLGGLDLPVRLVAVPEGALQGFNDEVLDLDHETFARDCAIDIPGPETDALGRLARKWGVFVMAQAKARHPEFPGRFFNVGFALDPDGEVVLRHHKLVPLLPVEHSMTPHNVYDRWVELYGETLDAFYPVAETEIGRLGVMMANEGSYPENARGLAMNGAEVVYRASFPHRASDAFEVQTRARALDNNFYVIAPNVGTYYLMPDDETPIDTFGGHSLIVDYLGRKMGELTLQRRLVLGRRHDRHPRPAPLPRQREVGQLDEGPHDRAVPPDLRAADLPQEPLRRARALQARRVPQGGARAPARAAARARRLRRAGRGEPGDRTGVALADSSPAGRTPWHD